ncbi:hypothetical protein [Bosea sp. RAC05]|uniref:hypothetical protein n=1 Tax=Bosea sp. RAC05 TaxID=1842539 RepID=UPI00083D1768|nr:hypothetical protein [Bosea sp. RAC05]AOG03153.1 hypothetical protein BSY19_5117 [Bosea sp. RAC05]
MTTHAQAATGGTDCSIQDDFDPWTDDPLLSGSCLAKASAADRDDLIALFASDAFAGQSTNFQDYGLSLAA